MLPRHRTNEASPACVAECLPLSAPLADDDTLLAYVLGTLAGHSVPSSAGDSTLYDFNHYDPRPELIPITKLTIFKKHFFTFLIP